MRLRLKMFNKQQVKQMIINEIMTDAKFREALLVALGLKKNNEGK